MAVYCFRQSYVLRLHPKKVQREGLLERKGKVIPCTGTVEKACKPSIILSHTTTTKTVNVTVGMNKMP